MAKKCLILKAQKKPKFSTRKINRCGLCGRPQRVLPQVRHLPRVLP